MNQCCCCDFLHNPVNKRIAWWMSFSFLLGILACCISAFVTVNRFGFALEGAWCAVDRIYYDSLYGQLTEDPNIRWDGIDNTKKNLTDIYDFCKKITNDLTLEKYFPITDENVKFLKIMVSLKQLLDNCDNPIKINKEIMEKSTDITKIKASFLDDFDYYAKTLNACLKILSMIYYCLLLIAITAAGVSMMFYACLKRQGYLITFMHVLWNVIRFFMFSFFLYGTAYGIAFLSIRDSIAVIKYIFGKKNLETTQPKVLGEGGKEFLNYCLDEVSDTNLIDEKIITSVKDFFNYIFELKDEDGENLKYQNLYDTICKTNDKELEFCENLKYAVQHGGFDKSFDCGFLKSDLNQLYKALSDASVESRILAALSLCSSFFGAVAVYFYLLVMHHYNNELFFDSGKSIFTGFDGFGGGYKKKVHDKDPAYKKRKLRAEIELTSKNDEQSAYKNVNKNEDEE